MHSVIQSYLLHFKRETQKPARSFLMVCKAGTEVLIETEILRII